MVKVWEIPAFFSESASVSKAPGNPPTFSHSNEVKNISLMRAKRTLTPPKQKGENAEKNEKNKKIKKPCVRHKSAVFPHHS
jgi:hypothetical protein